MKFKSGSKVVQKWFKVVFKKIHHEKTGSAQLLINKLWFSSQKKWSRVNLINKKWFSSLKKWFKVVQSGSKVVLINNFWFSSQKNGFQQN